MSWVVHAPKHVYKVLQRFPKRDQERVLAALRVFEINPWDGDIVKISRAENLWRKRVGNYRIFYSADQRLNVVEIKQIERRTSNTY